MPRARSFYTPKNSSSLGQGAEVWSGFFQSVRPAASGLVLNVDVSATAFHEARPVLDIARELWNLRSEGDLARAQVRDSDRKMLAKALHLVQVETSHRSDYKRRTRVSGVSRNNAMQAKFTIDGVETNVADYFRSQYNYTLRYDALGNSFY